MRCRIVAVSLAVLLAAAPAVARGAADLLPTGGSAELTQATLAGRTALWFDRLDNGRKLRVWSADAASGAPRLLTTAGPAPFLAWAALRASGARAVVLTELRPEDGTPAYGLLAGPPSGPLSPVASFRGAAIGASLPLQDVDGTRMLLFERAGARVRVVVRTADARGRTLSRGPSWPIATRRGWTPPAEGRLAGRWLALLRRGDPARITVYDARSGRRRWSVALPPGHAPAVPGNFVWDRWIAWDVAADGTVWAAVASSWPAWTTSVVGWASAARPRIHRIVIDGVVIADAGRDLWAAPSGGAVALVHRAASGHDMRRLVALSRARGATTVSPETPADGDDVVTSDGSLALSLVTDLAGRRCGRLGDLPVATLPAPDHCP